MFLVAKVQAGSRISHSAELMLTWLVTMFGVDIIGHPAAQQVVVSVQHGAAQKVEEIDIVNEFDDRSTIANTFISNLAAVDGAAESDDVLYSCPQRSVIFQGCLIPKK